MSISKRQIAGYRAIAEAGSTDQGRTPHDELWQDAMGRLLAHDGKSLVVFRQLLEASPSDESTAMLLTGYLNLLPWADDPEFVSWLQHMERGPTLLLRFGKSKNTSSTMSSPRNPNGFRTQR